MKNIKDAELVTGKVDIESNEQLLEQITADLKVPDKVISLEDILAAEEAKKEVSAASP